MMHTEALPNLDIEADLDESGWLAEDQAMLLHETVADLNELQMQVEHARHHAFAESATRNSMIDELLEGTATELAAWIDNVVDLSASQDSEDEAYESLSPGALEDELKTMPVESVVPVTHAAIDEVVNRLEERASRAEPGDLTEVVLLNIANSLRGISESLEEL